MRWYWKGKQRRKSAKTRSWTKAEGEKRKLEAQYEAAEMGKPVRSDEPVTVEQAIHAFINEKKGGKAAQNTLAKYELTLSRLEDFCTAKNIYFLNQITLEHLSNWRATWDQYYSSPFALRNNQSRLRAFFRYCENGRWITYNPARTLSAIKIRDEDYVVEELHLSDEELAFYDALEVNDAAVKIMGDEVLRQIAHDLVDTVRRNVTIDWTVKESVRTKLRTMVKRILRKYGYPPDKQENSNDHRSGASRSSMQRLGSIVW